MNLAKFWEKKSNGYEEFLSPGACKLLLGENGKEYLKMIEMEQKVDIVVERCVKQPIEAPPLPPRSRTRLASTLPKKRIYNQCKFTTKDGVQVSWKYGSIEKEAVSLGIT